MMACLLRPDHVIRWPPSKAQWRVTGSAPADPNRPFDPPWLLTAVRQRSRCVVRGAEVHPQADFELVGWSR